MSKRKPIIVNAAFKEYLEAQGLSEATISQYLMLVRNIETLKNPLAPLSNPATAQSTKNSYFCMLKSWARFNKNADLVDKLDGISLRNTVSKLPKHVRPLTEAEYSQFLDALEKQKNSKKYPWLYPSISLMVQLGLRAGVDLCQVRRDALEESLETGSLSLWTKRGKVRTIPCGAVVPEIKSLLELPGWTILAELVSKSSPDEVGSFKHIRSAYARITKAIKALAVRANLDPTKIHTHRFRHNFGLAVYKDSGNDLRMAQKALGHTSIQTTQNYIDVDEKALDKVISARRKSHGR